jgi:hypothetical protein
MLEGSPAAKTVVKIDTGGSDMEYESYVNGIILVII